MLTAIVSGFFTVRLSYRPESLAITPRHRRAAQLNGFSELFDGYLELRQRSKQYSPYCAVRFHTNIIIVIWSVIAPRLYSQSTSELLSFSLGEPDPQFGKEPDFSLVYSWHSCEPFDVSCSDAGCPSSLPYPAAILDGVLVPEAYFCRRSYVEAIVQYFETGSDIRYFPYDLPTRKSLVRRQLISIDRATGSYVRGISSHPESRIYENSRGLVRFAIQNSSRT